MKYYVGCIAAALICLNVASSSVAMQQAPKLSPAMQRVFDRADKNKNQRLDGEAEIREMHIGLRVELADADRANLPGGNATYQQLVALLGQVKPDKNGDGVISLAEFTELTADLIRRRDTVIAAARNQLANEQAIKAQLDKQRKQQNQQAAQQRLQQQQASQQRQQDQIDRAKVEQMRQLAAQRQKAEKLAEEKRAHEKRMATLDAQRKREAVAQMKQQKEEAEKRQKAEELRRKKALEQKKKDEKKK